MSCEGYCALAIMMEKNEAELVKLEVILIKSLFSAFLVSPRSAIPNARPVRSQASCARVSGELNAFLMLGARTSDYE